MIETIQIKIFVCCFDSRVSVAAIGMEESTDAADTEENGFESEYGFSFELILFICSFVYSRKEVCQGVRICRRCHAKLKADFLFELISLSIKTYSL